MLKWKFANVRNFVCDGSFTTPMINIVYVRHSGIEMIVAKVFFFIYYFNSKWIKIRLIGSPTPFQIYLSDLLEPITKGPAECDICGTYLLHAKEMPRHRETLKCRQAAFNKSQVRTVRSKNLTAGELKITTKICFPGKTRPVNRASLLDSDLVLWFLITLVSLS